MTAPFVLIVDDESGITKLCERLLSQDGFRTLSLTSPQKAMDYLRKERVDLLLVDIRMPKVDGFEVITFAKQHQPDIASLVMTGFGTVETAIKALRKGVDGLILKPFEKGSELVEAARQALLDNQRRRDAAHTEALRPLFNVTEAFLAETRPDHLPEIIVETTRDHLRCSHAAYYQRTDDEALKMFSKREQAQSTSVNGEKEKALLDLFQKGRPIRVTESENPDLSKSLMDNGILKV